MNQLIEAAGHLLRPRLVAKPRYPAFTSASVGRGFMRRPSRGWQMRRTFEGAPHLLQPRLVAKLRCPTITSASVGQGFMRRPSRGLADAAHLQRCAVPRGIGKCGTPSKVRRISYDLSLWQSYVAQPSPRLHSGRVSCAAPRGVWQMPSSFFFHHQPTRNTSCVPTNGFG